MLRVARDRVAKAAKARVGRVREETSRDRRVDAIVAARNERAADAKRTGTIVHATILPTVGHRNGAALPVAQRRAVEFLALDCATRTFLCKRARAAAIVIARAGGRASKYHMYITYQECSRNRQEQDNS